MLKLENYFNLIRQNLIKFLILNINALLYNYFHYENIQIFNIHTNMYICKVNYRIFGIKQRYVLYIKKINNLFCKLYLFSKSKL